MVREANVKQAYAEKLLKEANLKVIQTLFMPILICSYF